VAQLGALLQQAQALVPDAIRLTLALVEVNSHSRNVTGVNRAGRLLEEAFALPGLELRRIPGAAVGDHLFWSTAAARWRPPILLVGHHDTIFPPGCFEGFKREGARAYGPGCSKSKAGLALIWAATRTLASAKLLADIPLVIASVSDQELGGSDSRNHLQAEAERADVALVFEPGRADDAIVTARPGALHVSVTSKSLPPGAARTDDGGSAWSLARFVELARAQPNYRHGITFKLGSHFAATIHLEFETLDEAEILVRRLREVASTTALPETVLEVEANISREPMLRTASSTALYEGYAECQRAAGLGCGQHTLASGGSAANTLAGAGVPVIDALGPRGGGVHTFGEYLDVTSFHPKVEALVRFLCRSLR
jgi:glutamate carboxypeptidase